MKINVHYENKKKAEETIKKTIRLSGISELEEALIMDETPQIKNKASQLVQTILQKQTPKHHILILSQPAITQTTKTTDNKNKIKQIKITKPLEGTGYTNNEMTITAIITTTHAETTACAKTILHETGEFARLKPQIKEQLKKGSSINNQGLIELKAHCKDETCYCSPVKIIYIITPKKITQQKEIQEITGNDHSLWKKISQDALIAKKYEIKEATLEITHDVDGYWKQFTTQIAKKTRLCLECKQTLKEYLNS